MKPAAPLLASLISAVGMSLAPAAEMLFTNQTTAVGITHEHATVPFDPAERNFPTWFSGGAVGEDFDGDGWVDLYVVQGHEMPNLLYMNHMDEPGGAFIDEAAERGAALVGDGMGASAADFDNDGDVDICVTNWNPPHALLINDGTGHFTVDAQTLTLPEAPAMSSSWGDVDNDGLLELMAGNWIEFFDGLSIYRNRGGGTLETYQWQQGGLGEPTQRIFSPGFGDIDSDGLVDLLVVADFGRSKLFDNLGNARFLNISSGSGTGWDRSGMGSAIGDYDNDGDLDWFVSSIHWPEIGLDRGNRLYRSRGNGRFNDVTVAAGVEDGFWGWGSSFGDLDLDGDLDLYHVNGWLNESDAAAERMNDKPARLFENLGDGTFAEVAAAAGADDRGQGRGVVLADFDNDGDLDIFIANNQDLSRFGGQWVAEPGTPAYLRNETATSNHWLKVHLDGQAPLHGHGIGSRVHVTTRTVSDELTQMRELHASTNFLSQNPGRIAHFGVGPTTVIDEVRAEWVNGDATLDEGVPSDQAISLPSPTCAVSNRKPVVGEMVHATAAGVEPAGAPREWVIDGQTHPDPAAVSFSTPGPQELRLNLYESDDTTLLRAEVLRIVVLEAPQGILSR